MEAKLKKARVAQRSEYSEKDEVQSEPGRTRFVLKKKTAEVARQHKTKLMKVRIRPRGGA